MRDDEPADAVHDLFSETLFGDTPLGRSVLGTVESIEGLTRDDVDGWYRSRYAMPSIVVTAAGRVDHQQVLDLVTAAFGDRLAGDAPPGAAAAGRAGARPAGRARPALIAPPHRADPPAARRSGDGPARRAALRRRRARHRRRRRHELAAVPGDPREARAWSTASGPRCRHYAGTGLVLRLRRLLARSGCRRCCG